jgi:cysteinyl-tRNA synthetase
MNLTDVGHLTGDNLGDADTGEDRLEKSAKKEGKTAWEVAEFYTDAFLKDYEKLGLTQPEQFVKATDHIKEQIDLVKRLDAKGFTYGTSDGIYFDTSKFPEYGKSSNLDQIKEGARVEVNPEKRNPRDFALWKFSPKDQTRHMEWESPWGLGFPGWHIECSAMSMKYLGETLDIHTGGVDLRETHHPNEIAQSEAATGKPFVHYWVHSAFMLVQGERMSKSLGNNFKIYDLEKKGFEPLALRYLYLQTHYRQEMNFTLAALEAAQNALNNLRAEVVKLGMPENAALEYEHKFQDAMHNDLNTPEALAVMWEMLKSNSVDNAEKLQSLYRMDMVLGLDLRNAHGANPVVSLDDVPSEVRELVKEREELRKQKKFGMADQYRGKIKKLGYDIEDTKEGTEIRKL